MSALKTAPYVTISALIHRDPTIVHVMPTMFWKGTEPVDHWVRRHCSFLFYFLMQLTVML